MKTLLIAATLLSLPALASAQAVSDAGPSKINTAVRADVAARNVPASTAPATVGGVHVKTARMGEKTINLQDGKLPDPRVTQVAQNNPGG